MDHDGSALLLYFVRYIHGYMKFFFDSHIENVTTSNLHVMKNAEERETPPQLTRAE